MSAIEFLDAEAYALVTGAGARPPLEPNCAHYVLVELSGSREEHDAEKLNDFLEGLMAKGIVADGTIAQDETQSQAIWRVREEITLAIA